MTTQRVSPPSDGRNSLTFNGRTYSCAVGSTIDVPDFDALVLIANGWTAASSHGADVTANRPANPKRGMTYLDTTLGAVISFDGKRWRNPLTGAIV